MVGVGAVFSIGGISNVVAFGDRFDVIVLVVLVGGVCGGVCCLFWLCWCVLWKSSIALFRVDSKGCSMGRRESSFWISIIALV